MRIIFFIAKLSTGGAERQISVLANGFVARGYKVLVVTLFSGGHIADSLINNSDIDLVPLWSKKSRHLIVRMIQLALAPLILRKLIRKNDCIYSMLEATNYIAWLATRFKNISLIWGVRSSNMKNHWKMALFDKLCALASSTIKLIIVNSHSGLKYLLQRSYCPQEYAVIHNGIDTEYFQYNESLRKKMRSILGVSNDQILIGIVGRLSPMKDHSTFLKAAKKVVNKIENVRFLCVGSGNDAYLKKLKSLAIDIGLKERVIWLEEQSDMLAVYCALDLLVSSSAYGEGFSNVLGEAMSCGVSCVATDVGDSAMIIGETSKVVEPRNVEMLAQSIFNALTSNSSTSNREKLRERIEQNFSLKKLLDVTEKTLLQYCDVK